MERPLVSLCVPTANRAEELRAGLPSILGQDYPNLEILISDNASEDGTEAVGREAARLDPRVRYVRQPKNLGLYGNHNFCLEQARGEFLCFCHDHDERNLRLVSEYMALMREHPRVGVVCSDWEIIDEQGRCIGVRDFAVPRVMPGLSYIGETIRTGRSSIGAPGALIRRAALRDTRFDERAPIGFGDFLVWFPIAERAAVGHVARRLWKWRQHPQSQSARTIESMAGDYDENLSRYCLDHLARWPERAALVARWQRQIRRYLFWALAFEVGLYFRQRGPWASNGSSPGSRTVFEILDYRLDPEALARVLDALRRYRTGGLEYGAFFMVQALMRLRLTRPLAWATYHHTSFRRLLGLR